MAPLARRRYDIGTDSVSQSRAWAWCREHLGVPHFLGNSAERDLHCTDINIKTRWAYAWVSATSCMIWLPEHHALLLDLECP